MAEVDGTRAPVDALAAEYELDDTALEALDPKACARLLQQLAAGSELYRLRVPAPGAGLSALRTALTERLGGGGAVLWISPTPGTDAAAGAELDVTFTARAPELELLEILDDVEGVLERVPHRARLSRPPPAAAISIRPSASPPAVSPTNAERGAASIVPQSPGGAGVVPVEIERLDRLMEAVAELGVVQHGIGVLVEKARSGAAQPELLLEAQALQRSFERSVGSLRACALDTRMVSLVAVLDALASRARRWAAACGRALEVEVDDTDLELDKQVADALYEPLSQWLRHVVEFGIESRDDRLRASKLAVARVRIHASAQAPQRVRVEIEDDGSAFDAERARRTAVQQGMLTAAHAERLSPGELYDCAAALGALEGVDFARLQTQLRAVGGSAELDGEPGVRTRLAATVPLTLALLPTLLLEARGRAFALPLASVHEVVRRGPGPLRGEDGFLQLHGERVPVLELAAWLGLPNDPGAPPPRHVIALRKGTQRLAIAVDRALAQRAVLVKPLGATARDVRAVTGAAELGDGRVALVLDATALFDDHFAPGRALPRG